MAAVCVCRLQEVSMLQIHTVIFSLKFKQFEQVCSSRNFCEEFVFAATWCLRKILRKPYTRHTTIHTVWSIRGCCQSLTEMVKCSQLKFFGHLARSAQEEDHHRVVSPPHCDRNVWIVHTAWRKSRDRKVWQQVVSTATLF